VRCLHVLVLHVVLMLSPLTTDEKDSPTVDLTVRPLSGAITASLLLNSDGGSKVKTGDFNISNCLSAH
jgi:hypothetical protein